MIYIIEVNVICLFIILFTLSSVFSKSERQVSVRYYTKCIISSGICVLMDILFQLIENSRFEVLRATPFLNFADNCIYYIFDVLAAFFWFMYAEYSIEGAVKNKKILYYIALSPVIINTLLCIITYSTGLYFYIDDAGKYVRGPLFFVNTAICYLYVIFASIHALIKSFKTQVFFKKAEYRILSGYIVFPIVLAFIQIIYPDIPTVCLGMAIPIMYVHIKMQDLQISTDYLTNMNNRNQLIRYLTTKIKNGTQNLYVFMMDVDKFKHINDTYGHTEGDKALVSISEKLKEVARQYGGIIARYGGDEFTFATELMDESYVNEIKALITSKMEEASLNHTFKIGLSVGYAKYEKGMKLLELIAAADKVLYEEKRAKKAKDGSYGR